MSATTSTSVNLALTVAHAISYLTRPLIASHSATAIIKLQLILEANLTALYAPTWVVKEPLRGSGRRCLTFSPDCLPPRPIYAACISAGVQWFEWISALGNKEFDLFVDPGCVSVRFGRKNTPNGRFITVWVDEIASPAAEKPLFEAFQAPKSQSKTLAQQLLEDDHEDDDQLFSMIAHEINAPTWTTPIHAQFPAPIRSLSPLSAISAHSRSSSRSSNSSSTFSSSAASSSTSLSTTSCASASDSTKSKQSRRERARQAHVFIDTSKTEVTPYDGGKTTVLTGGVMLGGARAAPKPTIKVVRPTSGAAASWRSTSA
ncbi:hypothetical protein FPV67DRAFT_1676617 [Lyophyllum atratum]|nr:hypothetical protein FPV67DRAFT_1676617 [Lyophyllum atratum]